MGTTPTSTFFLIERPRAIYGGAAAIDKIADCIGPTPADEIKTLDLAGEETAALVRHLRPRAPRRPLRTSRAVRARRLDFEILLLISYRSS